jgi:pimeloyl-[acyl-carrier protein] methyl ester esterase
MPDITAPDGVDIHFDALGTGLPVVFVHGWAMSGRVWYFQRQFSDCRRVIIPDLRGHGLSGIAQGTTLTLDDMGRDLEALFTALGLEQAVVVGWSMGTMVVLAAYPRIRERIAGIVLVGGTPRFTSMEGYGHGLSPLEVRGISLRLKRDYSRTMGDFFRSMFSPGELTGEQYQRVVHEIVIPGRQPSHEAAFQCLDILAETELRPLLPEIRTPALLIHGEEDAICPHGASAYMAEHLPEARLEIMKGCGHAPFISRPETFNRLLSDFMGSVHADD